MELRWFLVYGIANRKDEFAGLLKKNSFMPKGLVYRKFVSGAEQAKVAIGRTCNIATVYSSDENYMESLKKLFSESGYHVEDFSRI